MSTNTGSNKPEWQTLLESGAEARAVMREAKKESSKYLWMGSKAAIEAWNPDADPTGEVLYTRVLAAMGKSRKGSASKIKTVALTRHYLGLELGDYKSLNAAYEGARYMTGADKVEQALVDQAPEGAYGLCFTLGKGHDGSHRRGVNCQEWTVITKFLDVPTKDVPLEGWGFPTSEAKPEKED